MVIILLGLLLTRSQYYWKIEDYECRKTNKMISVGTVSCVECISVIISRFVELRVDLDMFLFKIHIVT